LLFLQEETDSIIKKASTGKTYLIFILLI
jgi:hypothetical protein